MSYDHRTVEEKWQRRWEEAGVFRTPANSSREKFYVLDMFPYPSGAGLHVGHCVGYVGTDIVARYKRMQGFDVLHPFGFDAFGLPAENYAIKTGIHPRETTDRAIANFKRQLQSLGFAYDWDREIRTTDSEYYRWTQWIFLKLHERGLAYESVAPINWCASCQTGLANEEIVKGRCDRCGGTVDRKAIRQWMLRITDYADRLLDDLAQVDWPESTLQMQRNWIGRTEGAEITFEVDGARDAKTIAVYTTRPETLYGVTYVAIAPEHALSSTSIDECREAVMAYREATWKQSDVDRADTAREMTGVFTGRFAINPINGERIPIWIADYVLADFGTGAVMGVPAHDDRDHRFATQFAIPIREVVRPIELSGRHALPYCGEGICVNSPAIDGLSIAEARRRVVAICEARGFGNAAVRYRLRDWVFSRQRFWGEPIPIVHCERCGAAAVPESGLPVRLPEVERYELSGTGESPLGLIDDWIATRCPHCDGPAKRETNTMPQWAGSCWYYLRFLDPHNDRAAWSPESERRWMGVDLYVGGAEHAVLHLLYARFWHKVLFDCGAVSTKEPFNRLRHQGMVLAETYRDERGRYHPEDAVNFDGAEPRLAATGEPVRVEMEKMSKSKLNGIDPESVVRQHGADALRLYTMFMGDFELSKPWDPRAIEGCVRFLNRAWRLIAQADAACAVADDSNARLRHQTIAKVQSDIEAMKFNTAIAALMQFVTALSKESASSVDLDALIKCLAPFAPHFAEEAWHKMHGESAGFLIEQPWPVADAIVAQPKTVVVVVQINGKARAKIEVERDLAEADARAHALAHDNVQQSLHGKRIVKVIVVPNRIVSIVTD